MQYTYEGHDEMCRCRRVHWFLNPSKKYTFYRLAFFWIKAVNYPQAEIGDLLAISLTPMILIVYDDVHVTCKS